MKKVIIFLFFVCFWTKTHSQVWQVLFDAFFIDGIWYTLVETSDEPRWYETTYASYPYDLRGSGLFLPTDLEGDKARASFNLHFQNNENSLSGVFGQLKYSPISLLTIEGNRLQYFDADKEPNSENLNLTAFSILYNRLRHHKIHAWWGLGGIWLDDDENNSAPTFNTGFNYFFKDPISLYGDMLLTSLNDEVAAILQIRVQVHLRRFNIYGGYHYADLNGNTIGSWVLGSGVYF